VFTRSPGEFHKLLDEPVIDVLDFTHLNEHLDLVVIRPRIEFCRAPKTNSVVIACFVTSYARLHLYANLQRVDEMGGKRLYCDTFTLLNIYIYIYNINIANFETLVTRISSHNPVYEQTTPEASGSSNCSLKWVTAWGK
jgi:hypothetical protein